MLINTSEIVKVKQNINIKVLFSFSIINIVIFSFIISLIDYFDDETIMMLIASELLSTCILKIISKIKNTSKELPLRFIIDGNKLALIRQDNEISPDKLLILQIYEYKNIVYDRNFKELMIDGKEQLIYTKNNNLYNLEDIKGNLNNTKDYYNNIKNLPYGEVVLSNYTEDKTEIIKIRDLEAIGRLAKAVKIEII